VLVVAGGIVPMTAEPAQTLLVSANIPDLRTTTGDRVVVVALGANGRFQEEDGSRITLTGTGTSPTAPEVEVVGNGEVAGDGFTIVLENQPAGRSTLLLLR
jgi:hypothetical protein